MITIVTSSSPALERGLCRLLDRLGDLELSVCVQSAVSILAAQTGRPELADCIDDGRVSATGGGDEELADLFKLVLEELDAAVRTGSGPVLAA